MAKKKLDPLLLSVLRPRKMGPTFLYLKIRIECGANFTLIDYKLQTEFSPSFVSVPAKNF